MFSRLAVLSALVVSALAACSWPTVTSIWGTDSSQPTAERPTQPLTVTPSPFPPLMPTETPAIPQPTPTPRFDPERPWLPFAGPTDPSAIDIRPPAPRIEFAESVVNVVVLGSDARPYDRGYRTDVIMLVSLDPVEGKATMLSFPRDLYVYIPGWKVNRINTAEPHGGFEMISDTILYNFGIPVHNWARINFGGFISVVDLLGGIDVEVGKATNDRCGDRYYRFSPGTHHMDGWTAHCYVRMRYASSDFDRLRREQEVIEAIFRKVVSLEGLRKVPEFYSQFGTLVQTDIGLNTALPLVPLAAIMSVDSTRIHRYTIDSSMTTSYRVPSSGAAVQLPNWEQIEQLLEMAFGP